MFRLDAAELHVHDVERQQSHCCQDLSGRDDRALQKEYLVGLAGSYWFPGCFGAAILTSLVAHGAKCHVRGGDIHGFLFFLLQWGWILWNVF